MSNEIGAEQLEKVAEISRRHDCFPAKWRLRNERRNSILMTRHYPDLGSVSDWLKRISCAARQIRSIPQIRVVTRHEYGISPIVPEKSFRGKTSGSVENVGCFFRLWAELTKLRVKGLYKVYGAVIMAYWKLQSGKKKENKINENCETAIKTNDIRKLQNLTFKKGKLIEELANYHFQGNATFLRVDQHSHNRKPREIC